MKKLNLKKVKKHVAGAVAVSVASAGIVAGSLFSSPSELMDDSSAPAIQLQTAVDDGDQDGGGDDAAYYDEKRKGVRARMRLWVLRQPPWLRAMVGLPLWGLGWALITGFGALWTAVLSPVAGEAVKLLCLAALVLGVMLAALKAAFPKLPLRVILNRRSVSTVIVGLALTAAGAIVAGLVYPDSPGLRELIRWGGAFLVVLFAAVPALIRGSRVGQQTAEDAELGARRRVLELADSVK